MLAIREATQADLPAIVELLIDDELGRLREDRRCRSIRAIIAAFDAIDADPNQRSAGRRAGRREWSAPSSSPSCPASPIKARGAGRSKRCGSRAHLRGGGLGPADDRMGIARCRARGCRMVQLTSNATRTRAHGFYERLGFVGAMSA
jgi:GNAT superfamily N-acetyltransferase